MTDYKGRPLVAVYEDECTAEWITPDRRFFISFSKHSDLYRVIERTLSRCSDEPMRFREVEVLIDVPQDIVREALNVFLYPLGSEPSPEYAGLGDDPRLAH